MDDGAVDQHWNAQEKKSLERSRDGPADLVAQMVYNLLEFCGWTGRSARQMAQVGL